MRISDRSSDVCSSDLPGYEAVPLIRLTPAERQSLAAVQPGAAAGGDSYGVLVPSPGSGLMPVVICRETALLFLTLRAPGPPPDYVLAAPGGEGQRVLQQLLLDRVLEIEEIGRASCRERVCQYV